MIQVRGDVNWKWEERGYSNSEQDMKYPQRGQIILHFWEMRRLEQTGQN